MSGRSSIIRRVMVAGSNNSGSSGPDSMYVVDLYENDQLLESRELPGKSKYYADDVSENWENGIINLATDK